MIYINQSCLSSMSYNRYLESIGELPADGVYVWPKDPGCLQLVAELEERYSIVLGQAMRAGANVIIDSDVDMTKEPIHIRHKIVSCNPQYGFTRRELETVLAKLDGTEAAPAVDLSSRVAASVSLIKITEAKLVTILEKYSSPDGLLEAIKEVSDA